MMDERTTSSIDFDMEDSETTQPLLTENKAAAVLPRPHVFNHYHSPYVRYGVPIFLIATFILLLASDIGVGASAHVEMSTSSGKIISSKTNLEISVFSSIKKLWENDAVSERHNTVCYVAFFRDCFSNSRAVLSSLRHDLVRTCDFDCVHIY